jgi:hypothetical protein
MSRKPVPGSPSPEAFAALAGAVMPDAAAKVIAVRKRRAEAPAPEPRPPLVVEVASSEAKTACGSEDVDFCRVILTDAIHAYARVDDSEHEEKARAVIATLKDIAPRSAREALIARRMLALDAISMESLQLARRTSGNAPLRNMYVAQAVALSRAATALNEAIERMRGDGQQRVVIEHVHVYKGGKAIVGQVSSRAGDIPAAGR